MYVISNWVIWCIEKYVDWIYFVGCILEYINGGLLVFEKFYVLCYLIFSFLVLFLKCEICFLF